MTTKLIRMRRRADQTSEAGFTLLEYCAGAAVILVIIWAALSALGGNMTGLLESIGSWADRRAGEIDTQ